MNMGHCQIYDQSSVKVIWCVAYNIVQGFKGMNISLELCSKVQNAFKIVLKILKKEKCVLD